MKKLLVIVGPTAVGKTDLAAKLAKKFDGILISADSRQVYRGLDIGTGKDRPEGVEIRGYDLTGPKDEFSVYNFVKFATKEINNIVAQGKLPILVGGTGLYIKGVLWGIKTLGVPKNKNLRNILADYTPNDLYNKLAQLDPIKSANMNSSDKKNPRRLLRAIEIAQYRLTKNIIDIPNTPAYDKLIIGLKLPIAMLSKKIKKRVQKRVVLGLENEIKSLLDDGVSWEDQSMQSIGYKQWKEYFEHKRSRQEVIDKWARDEIKYAKRQMLWWNKENDVNWFDVSHETWLNSVDKLSEKWYSHSDESN